jgi:hypothetical protein
MKISRYLQQRLHVIVRIIFRDFLNEGTQSWYYMFWQVLLSKITFMSTDCV